MTLFGGTWTTIVEAPVNGTPTTVFDQAKSEQNDWSAYPPRVWVNIDSWSMFVGGN